MKQQILKLIHSPRVLILLMPFVLMAPVWLTGKALYWGTPSMQFVPWWWQAWQTLKAGELPLWNPLAGMGAPLLANYQSALLYPPTWFYFGMAAIGGLPLMAWGQALMVALHFAWAGWGMGLLIRRLGKSELAQAVGGMAFGLCGYLVARAQFLSINAAVSWLPWILLAAYDLIQAPKNRRNILKLALVLGLQWLAGHAQIAWYTLILAVGWTAFWAWKGGRWGGLVSGGLRFAMAGLLAFGLSAAQLLPTLEYLANSQRATQVDFAQAATYSFSPWRFIGLVAPSFFGNPAHGDYQGYGNYWEDAIYIGLLPFLLAVAGLLWSRKNREQKSLAIFLGIWIIISLILALGNNTPLFEWLFSHVTTFSLFQSPTRFTIWLVVALVLLAAFGVDQWRRPQGSALYWSRLSVAAAAAVIIAAGLAWWLSAQGMLNTSATFFPATLSAGIIGLAVAWLHLRAPTGNAVPSARWAWLVGGLVAADLLYAGWGLNPGANLELYKGDAAAQSGLRADPGNGRLYIPAVDEYDLRYKHLFQFDTFFGVEPEMIRASLVPNTFLLDGIPSANNYDPLLPSRYQNWMELLRSADADQTKALLARMNVTMVETLNDKDDLVFDAVEAFPRVRWSGCAQPAFNSEEAFSSVVRNIDPGVVMIEGSRKSVNCATLSNANVQLVESDANTLTISVEASGDGWLIVADVYYPGWRAYVDGHEEPIYPADGVFRGVLVEIGRHEVVLVYQPLWFLAGIGLSAASWLYLILFWRNQPIEKLGE